MSGIVSGILDRLLALLRGLIAWGEKIWERHSSKLAFTHSEHSRFHTTIMQHLGQAAEQLRSQANGLWSRVQGLWARLQSWARQQVQRFVNGGPPRFGIPSGTSRSNRGLRKFQRSRGFIRRWLSSIKMCGPYSNPSPPPSQIRCTQGCPKAH